MTRIYIDTDELGWLRREMEHDAGALGSETFQLLVQTIAAIDDAGPFAPLKTVRLQQRAAATEARAGRLAAEILADAESLRLFALAVAAADASGSLVAGLTSFPDDAWRLLRQGADGLAGAALDAGWMTIDASFAYLEEIQRERARLLHAVGLEQLRIGWADNAITITPNGAVWFKSDLLDTHLGLDATTREFAVVVKDRGVEYVDGVLGLTAEVAVAAIPMVGIVTVGGKLAWDTRQNRLGIERSVGLDMGVADVELAEGTTFDLATGEVVEQKIGVEADIIAALTSIEAGVVLTGDGHVRIEDQATLPGLQAGGTVTLEPGEIFTHVDVVADRTLVSGMPGHSAELHADASARRGSVEVEGTARVHDVETKFSGEVTVHHGRPEHGRGGR